jgi:hypothetical protein
MSNTQERRGMHKRVKPIRICYQSCPSADPCLLHCTCHEKSSRRRTALRRMARRCWDIQLSKTATGFILWMQLKEPSTSSRNTVIGSSSTSSIHSRSSRARHKSRRGYEWDSLIPQLAKGHWLGNTLEILFLERVKRGGHYTLTGS